MVEGWTEALKAAVTAVVTAAVAPADGDHEVTVGAGAGLAVWSSEAPISDTGAAGPGVAVKVRRRATFGRSPSPNRRAGRR